MPYLSRNLSPSFNQNDSCSDAFSVAVVQSFIVALDADRVFGSRIFWRKDDDQMNVQREIAWE